MTALLLACANRHENTAKLLVEPTLAAGALDVRTPAPIGVNNDGCSALIVAEERGLLSVAQMLRNSGAAPVRLPSFSLFRGKANAVEVNVLEQEITFNGYATVRSAQMCPLGSKAYYEIEVMSFHHGRDVKLGFASAGFERMFEAGTYETQLASDKYSWSVQGYDDYYPDGVRHNGKSSKYYGRGNEEGRWKVGDTVGLACDLDKMQILVSVNGSFVSPVHPTGVIFELAPDEVVDGLFTALLGRLEDMKVKYNMGEKPFKYSALTEDYRSSADFDV